MLNGRTLLTAIAGLALTAVASQASAGWWYIGAKHDAHYNARFLQRPYPPYHGWNRPLYGWSSNYRPYYFTPQDYANTPWNYEPCYQDQLMHTAAPPQGLNSYGVPVTSTAASSSTAAPTPYPQTPAPTLAVPQTTPATETPPAEPATPLPPKPSF